MATSTQTLTIQAHQGVPEVEQHELRQLHKPGAVATAPNIDEEAGGPSVVQQRRHMTPSTISASALASSSSSSPPLPPPPPRLLLKILGAGFSFFCAGVNDSTLGPLIPYMLTSFSIGTGEIAIIYACSFIGWLLAAITNPLLTPHLTLGQLLLLGAFLQLLAQCLRPWSLSSPSASLPLFCISFSLQALGTGYQDAHANTFVTSVNLAHRWLGFIHAMYALALAVGPLAATAIASHYMSGVEEEEETAWRKTYFVTIGLGVVNLVWMVVGFRETLWGFKSRGRGEGEGRRDGRGNRDQHPQQQQRHGREGGEEEDEEKQTASAAIRDMGAMMKLKDVWLISLFFFFALGACMTSNGWVVTYLVQVRGGDLSKVGYVPTGFSVGLLLGRLLLPEPTYRFGEKRMLLSYFVATIGFQLIFWLVPNIIADATALSIQGFFLGPFFPTGVSVASRIFPRKIQAVALSFVFVMAQAGAATFPSTTGLIAGRAGVQVLQPIILALLIIATIFWWFIPKAPERRE